jgi:hypothetical protein
MYCATGHVYRYVLSTLEFTWYPILEGSLIGALSCAPHNFKYNPLYLNCILAGLDDRKGEEAIGCIDNYVSTTVTTSSYSAIE